MACGKSGGSCAAETGGPVYLSAPLRACRQYPSRQRGALSCSNRRSGQSGPTQQNRPQITRGGSESKAEEFNNTLETCLFETWSWILASFQPNANEPAIEWDTERIQGIESLAARAAKKLANKEAFFTRIGPARIKMALDQCLWRDQKHLSTRQLWEWLATCLYPCPSRLRAAEVLRRAIEDSISGLVNDTFAYDKKPDRYIGLKVMGGSSVIIDSQSVIVRTDVALAQMATDAEAERKRREQNTEQEGEDDNPPPPPDH